MPIITRMDSDAVQFEHQLAEVARTDGSLKQVGARSDVAVQKLQLARRWGHRAAVIAALADFSDDPDFAFACLYQAFQDAADALLCAHGWRPGGERAHQRTFQLAAAGLLATSPRAATLLRERERTLRQARREIAYDRTGVVNRRDLVEAFATAREVLPALAARACALVDLGHIPAELEDWEFLALTPAGPDGPAPAGWGGGGRRAAAHIGETDI